MKNTGKCPKCASQRIVIADRKSQDYYIVTSLFGYALVHKYVCADCGFIEEWLAGENDVQKVRDTFL